VHMQTRDKQLAGIRTSLRARECSKINWTSVTPSERRIFSIM
jgi:hypothetical protein